MKYLKFFIVPILIAFLLKIIFLLPFWEVLEHQAQDLLFLIRGDKKLTNDVVLVEIGDTTFSSLNEQWPFPRKYYAKLIDNLELAGAKLIVFDIEFTEASDKKTDEFLAQTAAKYNNVIFSGKVSRQLQKNYVKEQVIPPIKALTQRGLTWGTVNISADNDGFVRKYELFQTKGEKKIYSIGMQSLIKLFRLRENDIFQSKKALQIDKIIIPKVNYNSTLINYAGPANSFPTYDFADVLDDSTFSLPFLDLNSYHDFFERGVFRNKIVIIGVTGEEFHDAHSTPFLSVNKQLMPGVEVHANFIDMALRNDFLHSVSFLRFSLFFFLASILLFVLNYYVRPSFSVFISIALLLANFGVAYYLFSNQNISFPILDFPLLIIILYILGLISQYIRTSKERKFIKNAFRQYIAPDLVNELIKNPKKLEYGGTQKEITVLFSDIRSFTPYSESHSPKEVVSILQEYLTAMVDVITKNKGTLDKFVGDEIMALWGVPLSRADHAFWACKAAIEMRQKLNELQDKWKKEKKDIFEIGIGINSGLATVGNLGSEQIFDYTAIGDTINAGARLEAINKNYQTENHIIISEETYLMAKDKLIVKFLDDVLVKGKSKTIRIYELIGLKEEI